LRCGLHTRTVTEFVTVIRGLQTFRRLHACPGCFRLERFAGRGLHPLEKRRLATAHVDGRHYQLNFIDPDLDNPDQRISENTKHAIEMTVEFALGIFNAMVTLVSFVGVLWAISGALDFTLADVSFHIPGYMVYAALLYAGIGSTLTYFVGRPIVAANLRQNAKEADYRFALVRLRENSEAVALIRGEAREPIRWATLIRQLGSAAITGGTLH
jgi:ABC-type uncharacterized transport system fused permease/ATPase subunit